MRGRLRVGVLALSSVGLLTVVGRVGVSAAFDDAKPSPRSAASMAPPADFGPVPQHPATAEVAAVSVAAFGAPPLAFGPIPFQRPRHASESMRRDHEQAAADLRRSRLTALAAEVSTLASEAELDALIAQLETAVAERRAEAELREARESLERVVAAFPETDAADVARGMLDRKRAGGTPEKLVPVEAPR